MTSTELRNRLVQGLLIFDGAMGTEIYRRNYFINTSFEQLSLTAPQVISEIHRQYAEAGAEVLTTNTYNANAHKLAHFGLVDQMAAINRAGVELAREAGTPETLVAGAIGPFGQDAFQGENSVAEAAAMLKDQALALLDAGADLLIFESLASRFDVEVAAATVRQLPPETAYILSFALDDAAATGDGCTLAELLELCRELPAAAFGINCGCGPESTLAAVEKAMPLLDRPLVVQPNAGGPRRVDDRTIYLTSPEYFSTYALRYAQLGARGLGGCCGITPAHIRDLARAAKPLARAEHQNTMIAAVSEETPLCEPIPFAKRSKLAAKIAAGEWITSVEITPPRGFDLTSTLAKAAACKTAGIDVINLPDGPRASCRISSLVTGSEIQRQVGIEVMLHLCARDRSLIGLQSEMLGCAGLQINNILFITGDPPKLGDYPFSSGVFDVDAIGMVGIAARMNRGVDAAGKSIEAPTSTLIAVGADPNAIDPEREYRRICEKAEAGAEMIVTQPVFAVKPLFDFLDRIAHLKLPVMAGVWPLASYRNAEFMRNEVPGVVVPDDIMVRMAAATGREEQRAVGIAIAREAVAAIRDRVQGVQVSAPFGNVQTALAVHQA